MYGINPLNSGGFLSAVISSAMAFCDGADYISLMLVRFKMLI